MNNQVPLTYQKELFVARKDEIQSVRQIIKEVGEGKRDIRRTIAFTGERGIGKSWLLQHLNAILQAEPRVRTFYFNLEQAQNRYEDPQKIVADLIKRFRHEIIGEQSSRAPLGASLAEMNRTIINDLHTLPRNYVLVILADSVYESNWELLSLLEDYFLASLAIEPHTVIVMTGRGRPYPWRTPELGTRAQIVSLEGFDIANTIEQLRLLKEVKKVDVAVELTEQPVREKVLRYSNGNPLANSQMALSLDTSVALDQTINNMLSIVPEQDRGQIRKYLEALCVLRAFKEDRIPFMLGVYYDDASYYDWGYREARNVREMLTRYALAHWEEEKYGYQISQSPREQIEEYIKKEKPQLWHKLHCMAHSLYSFWADRYQRARDLWQSEADHHADVLESAGYDEASCADMTAILSEKYGALTS